MTEKQILVTPPRFRYLFRMEIIEVKFMWMTLWIGGEDTSMITEMKMIDSIIATRKGNAHIP